MLCTVQTSPRFSDLNQPLNPETMDYNWSAKTYDIQPKLNGLNVTWAKSDHVTWAANKQENWLKVTKTGLKSTNSQNYQKTCLAQSSVSLLIYLTFSPSCLFFFWTRVTFMLWKLYKITAKKTSKRHHLVLTNLKKNLAEWRCRIHWEKTMKIVN